jgi:predicted nucleic acid-binding protein
MPDKFFIDSNVCLYLFDKDRIKATTAEKLFTDGAVISTQVLAEIANVLVKKFLFSKKDAIDTVRFIKNKVEVQPVTHEVIDLASGIFIRYGFSFFDSMIIAAALSANCTILYSEDLHPKQVFYKKLTVINPFVK